MKVLCVLNDPPYGTERSYNGLRLAGNILRKDPSVELAVFLLGDAVFCAKAGQQTPDGYYNVERMLKPIVRSGKVLLCGTCMNARGLGDDEILDGCTRSTLDELTELTLAAEKVLVF
ncbi:MAG: DsrE family protein [Deltaproteobacteria bacterium]|nr:DsrE family protein [Deltaproteobacteria bacterium]